MRSENPYADEQRKLIETVVAVMLPLENGPGVLESYGAPGEPGEPGEMDMTKMRQWLRDKLFAIGFHPQTEAVRAKFDDYLGQFSKQEVEEAFVKGSVPEN